MALQQEIVGIFRGEIRHFGDGEDQPRIIIGEMKRTDRESGDTLTIKGEAAVGDLKPDLSYRWYGYWKDYFNKRENRNVPQFNFTSFVVEVPADRHGVVEYLKQCDGIGPATAYGLFERYGADAVRKLRESPDEVQREVGMRGFSLAKAVSASKYLTEWQRLEKSKIEMLGLLNGRGFFKKTPELAIGKWGARAAEIVRQDPFKLMSFSGAYFGKCDKMFLALAKDHEDATWRSTRLKRLALCAANAVTKSRDGSTWVKFDVADQSIKGSISSCDLPQHRVNRAIHMACRAGLIVSRVEQGVEYLAEAGKAAAESRLAQYLHDARREWFDSVVSWPDVADLNLDEDQREELKKALLGFIGCFTGAPGTGKTHCIAELVRLLIRVYGQDCVAICAPTGAAAIRITEAMADTGLRATTIHRLLKVKTGGDGDWEFEYGRHKPLPFRFVICDESSMMDSGLMESLMAARGRGTHVLCVGDPGQLKPVGTGQPLIDMIAAGVPTGELRKIRRNSGRVIHACAQIRDTRKITCSPTLALPDENLIHVERRTASQQADELLKMLGSVRSGGQFDPVWDVQVIVPLNAKSELSRKILNPKLQQFLNPHGQQLRGVPFRVGDKIVCTQNGRLPSVEFGHPEADGKGRVEVANGEQAEVVAIELNRFTARLSAPDRLVTVPRGTDNSQSQKSDNSDEESDDAAADTGCNFELAYASSCHKAQGKQWPIVVVLIDDAGGRVCSWNWVLTAISRLRVWGCTIGKKTTLDGFLVNDPVGRKTFLVEMLRDLEREEQRKPREVLLAADEVAGMIEGLV